MQLVTPTLVAALLLSASAPEARRVELLTATSALPPHLVGLFRSPGAFQRDATGAYFVFDRTGHAVYRIDAQGQAATKLVDIGPERGRILLASSFALGADGRFVVADAPNRQERVQIFSGAGERMGGFSLPGRAAPRIQVNELILNGIGSLQYTGTSVLMNQPETGGLVTEFTLGGWPLRTFGSLRPTRHEDDRDVHLALNSGLPLVNPQGGYYFVFQAGMPMFRKYDDRGRLIFERHIEGPELDPVIAHLPTTWPMEATEEGRLLPVIPPTVRTAAVDPGGNLWIALTVAYTYVYDQTGEKVRTVRFRGAGIIEPDSFFFDGNDRLLVTPGCYVFTVR